MSSSLSGVMELRFASTPSPNSADSFGTPRDELRRALSQELAATISSAEGGGPGGTDRSDTTNPYTNGAMRSPYGMPAYTYCASASVMVPAGAVINASPSSG